MRKASRDLSADVQVRNAPQFGYSRDNAGSSGLDTRARIPDRVGMGPMIMRRLVYMRKRPRNVLLRGIVESEACWVASESQYTGIVANDSKLQSATFLARNVCYIYNRKLNIIALCNVLALYS